MEEEIDKAVSAFRERWKYHNLSIILGFFIYIAMLAVVAFIMYTLFTYSSDNKILIVGVQLIMLLVVRQLYKNVMPSKEIRNQYVTEYYSLEAVISNIKLKQLQEIRKELIRIMSDKKDAKDTV